MLARASASDEIMKRLGFLLVVLSTGGTALASPDDLHVRAGSALAAMSGNAQRVRGLLHKARARNVTSEVRCVDAALSRVDAAVRSGRDESHAMELALARGDGPGAARSLVALLGYREATRVSALAADACFGGVDVVPAEGTVVSFVVDPSMPPDRAVFPQR
jgi:hypothetical protein